MINKNNNFKIDSNSNSIIPDNFEEKKIIKTIVLKNNNTDNKNLNNLEELNSSTNIINNYEKKEIQISDEKKLYEENGCNVNNIDEIIEKERKKFEIRYNQKELKLKNELEICYKNEINDYIDNINKLKNELRLKDENLIKISQINETLRKNLSQFSDKINSLFNNSMNQNKTIQKLNADIPNKEKVSLEEQLKMKEIQLKSKQNFLDAINKENKSLKVKLDIFTNDESKQKILEDLKIKDDLINKLNEEKKGLKFQLEEHKKCLKQFEMYKKEIDNLTQKLIKYRDKYKKLKVEYDKLNSKDLNNNNNTNKKNVNNNNNNLNFSKRKNKKFEISKTPVLNQVKKKLNVSKSESDIKEKKNKMNNFSLFSDIEKKAISTLFNNQEDLNSFNKKISIIQSFKSSNENTLRNTIKLLKNELCEKEEIIQYLSAKFKENEQMLIVSLNQNNESDKTNQMLKRKINEQKEIINNLKNENNNTIENNDLNDSRNNDISKKVKIKLKEINTLKKDLEINNGNFKSFRLSSNNIMNSIAPLNPKMLNSNRDNNKKNELNENNNNHLIKLTKNEIIQK